MVSAGPSTPRASGGGSSSGSRSTLLSPLQSHGRRQRGRDSNGKERSKVNYQKVSVLKQCKMMRCGYYRDTMPREEASARRTRYVPVSEPPIGGRSGGGGRQCLFRPRSRHTQQVLGQNWKTDFVSRNKWHQTQPGSQQVRTCLCWPCMVTTPHDQAPRWGIKRRRIKALDQA